MALAKVKTEMKGDTSRWGKRAEYKAAAKKRRRRVDKRESLSLLSHMRPSFSGNNELNIRNGNSKARGEFDC